LDWFGRDKMLSHLYWSPVLTYDKDGDFMVNFFWNEIDKYFLQPVFNYAFITGLITTKEPLDVQIWRGRSHNIDGSTVSWRSRIQFPLQRFSYYKQQLALTSTSITSPSQPYLNSIQPSTINEIQLLASYSPIYKQLWTLLAKCNGCLAIFPEKKNNNDNIKEEDNNLNKEESNDKNDNKDNNYSTFKNAKPVIFY
jgi:hypothetical protein